jgi:signal transduction histidine kinase
VEVSVTLKAEALCIEVCDNGPGFPTAFSLAAPGGGHGLRNIAERLSGYYGDSARILWENQAKGTMVRLQIPRRGAVARPSI